MSLYPNIADSDEECVNFLDELSANLDPSNVEQMSFFSKLQKNPNNSHLLQQLILATIKPTESTSITRRLALHLKSHVELLEAITHNVELASLFLVGENGAQTFNNFHKSILQEQISRTRFFLATHHLDNIKDKDILADYRYFTSNVEMLDSKLENLKAIENEALKTKNLQQIEIVFNELCSLFNGCMVFNDILIQHKGNENENQSEILTSFPEAPKNSIDFIQWVKDLIKANECAVNTVSRLQTENKRLIEQVKALEEKSKLKEHEYKNIKVEMKKDIETLQSQKNLLSNQIQELEEKINISNASSAKGVQMNMEIAKLKEKIQKNKKKFDDEATENKQELDNLRSKNNSLCDVIKQKKSKISILKNQLQEVQNALSEKVSSQNSASKEIKDLQKLYQNASNQLIEIKTRNSEILNEKAKLAEKLEAQKKFSQNLKSLLMKANTIIEEKNSENNLLLKQITISKDCNLDDTDDLKREIASLKRELACAHKFIEKLQRKIESFQRKHKKTEIIVPKQTSRKVASIEIVDQPCTDLNEFDYQIRCLERNVHQTRRLLDDSS